MTYETQIRVVEEFVCAEIAIAKQHSDTLRLNDLWQQFFMFADTIMQARKAVDAEIKLQVEILAAQCQRKPNRDELTRLYKEFVYFRERAIGLNLAEHFAKMLSANPSQTPSQ